MDSQLTTAARCSALFHEAEDIIRNADPAIVPFPRIFQGRWNNNHQTSGGLWLWADHISPPGNVPVTAFMFPRFSEDNHD